MGIGKGQTRDLPVIEEKGKKVFYSGDDPKGFRRDVEAAGGVTDYMEKKGMKPSGDDPVLIVDSR